MMMGGVRLVVEGAWSFSRGGRWWNASAWADGQPCVQPKERVKERERVRNGGSLLVMNDEV